MPGKAFVLVTLVQVYYTKKKPVPSVKRAPYLVSTYSLLRVLRVMIIKTWNETFAH